MAWALQFDGVNDFASFPPWTASGDYTVVIRVFTGNGSSSEVFIGDSTTNSNYIYNTNSQGVIAQVIDRTTGVVSPVLELTEYEITLERVDVTHTLTVAGVGSGVRARGGDVVFDNFGSILAGLFFSGQLRGQVSLDNNAGDVRLYDIDASDHLAGTVKIKNTLDATGTTDATGVNMPTDGSAWVDLGGGGVTVTGITPSFNYSSIAASIDLTGSIDITGQTANYTYSPVGGAVDLTGDILITGATASYNYQSINAVVDLTGEITVIGLTPSQSYSSVSGIIELGAVISVIGITPNYNYQGIAGEVSLNGEILVSGETPSYSYSAIKGFVTTGEAQVIGTVTSSFASDVYSSGFKPNTITVNFKS